MVKTVNIKYCLPITYLLTYSSALQPSDSLGLLNFVPPFFPIDYLLSLSLKFHLPQILLHTFQPSQSWSSFLLFPSGGIKHQKLKFVVWNMVLWNDVQNCKQFTVQTVSSLANSDSSAPNARYLLCTSPHRTTPQITVFNF